MSDEQTGDSRDEEQGGPVIAALRKNIRDRDKQLKELEAQIQELTDQLEGQMPETVEPPDIEDTKKSDPGVEVEAAQEPQPGPQPDPHQALRNVTSLSTKVASAAKGQSPLDPSKAESPEELRDMMAKQGLLADHSSY